MNLKIDAALHPPLQEALSKCRVGKGAASRRAHVFHYRGPKRWARFALPTLRLHLHSPNRPKHWKRLQQPSVELRKEAGEEGDAGEHQEAAHGALDMSKVGA